MRRAPLLLVFAALGARAEDAPTPDAINRAIDAGIAWLKSAQREDGSYGPCVGGAVYGGGSGGGPCYHLGPTAFSLFTLSVCGVPRDDPVIERGLAWLRKRPGRDYAYTGYESSALVLMLASLNGVAAPRKLPRSGSRMKPAEGVRFAAAEWRWLDERVQHILETSWNGGFGYVHGDEEPYADVSATQFAALALRAAAFAGYPVRAEVWAGMVEFLAKLQYSSGGFPYHEGSKPSRGTTAAALSTLLIAAEQIALHGAKAPPQLAAAIENGLRYLDANFDVERNPSEHFGGHDAYHYCHLYAIERTGVLSLRREFGGKGWYARGAAFLLSEQETKGRWTDRTCMDPEDVLGTCFALLFLKKATIPAITR